MNYRQQIQLVFSSVPFTATKHKPASLVWLVAYLLSGIIIFGLLLTLLVNYQPEIRQLVLSYLFPESWHGMADWFFDFLYGSQTKTVIANGILSTSLVVASVFLFPLKELYSAQFERDSSLSDTKIEEFPLKQQAIEEAKLFLLYATAQSLILWIGYYPYEWANWISNGLSYLFLFAAFAIDFISPTLQRHRLKYSVQLKALFSRPILLLGFGGLFSLPSILLGQWILTFEEIALLQVSLYLFLFNLLFLSIAIPAGTKIASKIKPLCNNTLAPSRKFRRYAYLSLALLLSISLSVHYSLALSIHHKSQLLKAEYDIDWSSIDYEIPSVEELFGGKALSKLSFDLKIKNSTPFDIAVEDSIISIHKFDNKIADIDVAGFSVPSGHTNIIKIAFDSNSDTSSITDLTTILDGWRVNMRFELLPGIPFVMNLVSE